MQSALSQAFSEPLLAAMPQLSEKLHQGVPSSNPALYLGHEVCKSTTALGLRAALHLERVRSRYTQKERDNESGNDYFFARYYTSALGRFTTPDWSAKVSPVPYAKFNNPQSLDLYSYMLNNPMAGFDPDGHDGVDDKIKATTEKIKNYNKIVNQRYQQLLDNFVATGKAPNETMKGQLQNIVSPAGGDPMVKNGAIKSLKDMVGTQLRGEIKSEVADILAPSTGASHAQMQQFMGELQMISLNAKPGLISEKAAEGGHTLAGKVGEALGGPVVGFIAENIRGRDYQQEVIDDAQKAIMKRVNAGVDH
jgi:RHS repeat-associated protein